VTRFLSNTDKFANTQNNSINKREL